MSELTRRKWENSSPFSYFAPMSEDDDDDGSVNHQKSSHVDMTNDHLQDNNRHRTSQPFNREILSPKKPAQGFLCSFELEKKTF